MSGEDLRATRDTGRKERNPVTSGLFAEPSSAREEVGCIIHYHIFFSSSSMEFSYITLLLGLG